MVKLLAFAFLAFGLHGSDTARDEIVKVERDWHSAYVKHDPAILERVLADDYISISSRGGASSKASAIEGLKADKTVYDESTPYDLDIRIYGDSAVVVGRTRDRWTSEGKTMRAEYRWTDVFVKRDGRWQCTVAQVTSLPEPKTGDLAYVKLLADLNAAYELQGKAFTTKSGKDFTAIMTPDFKAHLKDGHVLSRTDLEGAFGLLAKEVTAGGTTIDRLVPSGNEAIAYVTHSATRASGTERAAVCEIWVRTKDGWKLRYVEQL